MDYQRLLIEIIIIICYWVIEKLFSLLFINLKVGRQGFIHHPSIWTILFGILTWWNLGYYYIAYPVLILALFGIIIVVRELVNRHEFLYQRFWPIFWRGGCVLMIFSYVVSVFCYHLPTP